MAKKIYKLRKLRKAAGMSQQQTAEKAGVNLSTYQAIETGRGNGFSTITKHKIADVFGIPLLQLFPEVEKEMNVLMKALAEK
jgi:transcriptional regulator with XRE-family HTH domain